jgi:hypothetical protein
MSVSTSEALYFVLTSQLLLLSERCEIKPRFVTAQPLTGLMWTCELITLPPPFSAESLLSCALFLQRASWVSRPARATRCCLWHEMQGGGGACRSGRNQGRMPSWACVRMSARVCTLRAWINDSKSGSVRSWPLLHRERAPSDDSHCIVHRVELQDDTQRHGCSATSPPFHVAEPAQLRQHQHG